MNSEWKDRMNHLGKKGQPFLFILDFDLAEPFVIPIDDIDNSRLLYSVSGLSNNTKKTTPGRMFQIEPRPVPYVDFKEKYKRVVSEIQAGNTYLLNLCFKTPIKLDCTLEEVFYISRAPYKLWKRDHFVLFSPESFVKIKDGIISTFPMKGTLEKTGPDSAYHLLRDKKEAAEHATITDLLRNDLGRVSSKIRVKRYRYIDEIKTREKTLLQVSSEIEGILDTHFRENLGDLFIKLLPAGSVTGAPKKKTVEIIKETENFSRGFYTGVFGIFDGRNVDSAVMIRFIEKEEENYYYKSGGGITFMSDPEKEYNEIIQKIYVPVY